MAGINGPYIISFKKSYIWSIRTKSSIIEENDSYLMIAEIRLIILFPLNDQVKIS